MSVAENVLALPAHVSHSQVSTWSKCGRQYLLERVMRLETQPQGALIGGSAVHDAIEAHLADDADPAVAFTQLFTQSVKNAGGVAAVRWGGRKSKAWPEGESFDWWLAEGTNMVARAMSLLAAFRESGREIVSHEAQYQFEVDGRPVVAKPDLVLAAADGIWEVVDWKTGSMVSPQNPIQLAIYVIAVSGTHGLDPAQAVGQVAMLRKDGADGLVRYNPAAYLELAQQMIRDFIAGTEAGVMAMSPGPMCVSCGVKAHCAYGRTLPTEGGDE